MTEPTPLAPLRAERRREAAAAALAHVYEAVVGLAHVLDGVPNDPLRLSVLRSAVRQAQDAALDAHEAAAVLAAGTALAEQFPDGAPRPAGPMTPRQVLYLADLARAGPTLSLRAEVAERAERHREAVAAHDADYGFHRARRCQQTTRAGQPCRASALPFVERPACHAHATEDERAANAGAGDAYWATYPGGDPR